MAQNLAGQVVSLVGIAATRRGNRSASDIERTAFVTAGPAVAAFTHLLAGCVSSNRSGTRAGYQNNGSAVRHCRQRQIKIGSQIDANPREVFFEQPLHAVVIVGIGSSGE